MEERKNKFLDSPIFFPPFYPQSFVIFIKTSSLVFSYKYCQVLQIQEQIVGNCILYESVCLKNIYSICNCIYEN